MIKIPRYSTIQASTKKLIIVSRTGSAPGNSVMEGVLTMKCNACGKTITMENGYIEEDVFQVSKEWGYFSQKDLEVHRFNLCEECYDRMIAEFVIPVDVQEKSEVLGTVNRCFK